MAGIKCPNCGLFNPSTAQACDCGYRLVSARTNSPVMPSRFRGLVAGVVRIGVLAGVLRERVPAVPMNLPPRPTGDDAPSLSARRLGRRSSEIIVTQNGWSLIVSNTAPHSFAYELPGSWTFAREPGSVLRSDGSEVIAVFLLSPLELRFIRGDTPLVRAAARTQYTFQTVLNRYIPSEVKPLSGKRFPAAVWAASWATDDAIDDGRIVARLRSDGVSADETLRKSPHEMEAMKVFLDIGADWVAQVTCVVPEQESSVDSLIQTLGTTPTKEAYWPLLHQRFPELVQRVES